MQARLPAREEEGEATSHTRTHLKMQARAAAATTRDNAIWLAVCLLVGQLLLLVCPSAALKFGSVQIPALVQRGANFWLGCLYEQQADEQLYSVKWYKNNEEFYRLLASPSASWSAEQQQQQQRHFPVAGVNVMMSQSNATHVRLLNASLESEGSYACEISTQNLSTIRHEREMRVYVLPANAKLQVAGLKSRYSLGERVELHCSSDFSRPAGSIAWFINNRRISNTNNNKTPDEQELAALASITSARLGKSNEMQRVHSVLKFRLTLELLARVAAAPALELHQLQWAMTGGNQSRRSGLNLQQLPGAASYAIPPLLSIECRYKLTEVSEVTFSELLVSSGSVRNGGASSSASSSSNRKRRKLTTTSRPPNAELANRRRAAQQDERDELAEEAEAEEAEEELMYRGSNNQIVVRATQRSPKSLGAREHFARLLERARSGRTGNAAAATCKLGALALDPDDPVILEASAADDARLENSEPRRDGMEESSPGLDLEAADRDDGAEAMQKRRRRRRRSERSSELQHSLDSALRLNCSTLGALEAELRVQLAATRPGQAEMRAPAAYCNDTLEHRRSLISGKYHTPKSVAAAAASAEPLAPSRQRSESLVARQRALAPTGGGGQPQSQPQLVAYLTLSDAELAAQRAARPSSLASAPFSVGLAGEVAPTRAATPSGSSWWSATNAEALADRRQVLAPPLLEWFINNQEAPDSSVLYRPALPLLSAAATPPAAGAEGPQAAARRVAQPDGARAPPNAELPAIDYQEYFANFIERPLEQHLALDIKLARHHFEATSLLKLRCSSTKAQVLASESISIGIYATNLVRPMLAAGPANEDAREETRTSAWQRRPPPNAVGKFHSRASHSTSGATGTAAAHGARQQQQQQQLSRPRSNVVASERSCASPNWPGKISPMSVCFVFASLVITAAAAAAL